MNFNGLAKEKNGKLQGKLGVEQWDQEIPGAIPSVAGDSSGG